MTTKTEKISTTIRAKINAPVAKVWTLWTDPKHLVHWNNASDDWHTPKAENDLRVGGKFLSRMEARDGSMGFDFTGEYTNIELHKHIAYFMHDGRKVAVHFAVANNRTTVTETFDAEQENPVEMQRAGWQSILDNFKNYVENH
jgi:uncharacterized protein YndB with AHSA1/START domain